MTLVVDNTNLPVIRYPNFEDLTWYCHPFNTPAAR